MRVEIKEQAQKLFVGMEWYGKLTGEGWSAENPIGQLWTRFNTFWDSKGESISSRVIRPGCGYEINIWNNQESQETGRFRTFVGVEVDTLGFEIPLELVAKILPQTTYAHLVARGKMITQWENDFYTNWLPASGYALAGWHAYHFQIQQYEDGRFLGLGDLLEKSEIDVWVPLVQVSETAVSR